MSNQGSVFIPNNGANQFQDMLSQSSVPNWSKVSNEGNAMSVNSNTKNLMNEINNILSDVRREAEISPHISLNDAQTGGAKKKANKGKKTKTKSKSKSQSKGKGKSKGKSMQRATNKKTKTKSKSKSKSAAKTVKAVKPAKVAKPVKTKSKTKTKSTTGKKQKGGETKKKKEMNPAMKNMRELAIFIKTTIPELKDGAPMMSTANKLIKKHNGLDGAMAEVKKNKSAVKKLYNEVAKEQKENREKKKQMKSKTGSQ